MTLKRTIKRYTARKIYLLVGDFIVLLCAILITISLRYRHKFFFNDPFSDKELLLFYFLVLLFTLFMFRYSNLYKSRIYLTIYNQIATISKAVFYGSILLIVNTFFLKSAFHENNARLHFMIFLITCISLTSIYRYLFIKVFYKKTELKNLFQNKIIAVGAGKLGASFAEKIKNIRVDYFDLVGFIDDDESKKGNLVNGVPVLGNTTELEGIVREKNIDEIFITIESISYEKLMDLIAHCKKIGIQANLFSSHYNVIQRKIGTTEIGDLNYLPLLSSIIPIYSLFLKSIIDKILTLIILIPLFPIMLIIGILIKLTSRGPVFYKTKVIGKNGNSFIWYKFRTMSANNNQDIHQQHLEKIIKENKPVEKIKNDPRITKVGKFLRKFSLDELPQLLNVLKGEMSLIGPRPCLPYEFELMDEWQKRRTSVTPGITGLWQITGRNKKDVTFNDSMVLDLYYLEKQSFGLDLKIFLKTIPVVLFGNGGT